MNIRAYMRARRLALPQMEKAVLLAVCARMDRVTAAARASNHTLVQDTGASRNTVTRSLESLRRQQLLVVHGGPGRVPRWTPGALFPVFEDGDEPAPDGNEHAPVGAKSGEKNPGNLPHSGPGPAPPEDANLAHGGAGQPGPNETPTCPMVGLHLTHGGAPMAFVREKQGGKTGNRVAAQPARRVARDAPVKKPPRDAELVEAPGFGLVHPDTHARLVAQGRIPIVDKTGGEVTHAARPPPLPSSPPPPRGPVVAIE